MAGESPWQRVSMQLHCPDCHHVWVGQVIMPPDWGGDGICPDCPKCGYEWCEAHEKHDFQPAFDPRYSICATCHMKASSESR
jgi:hypothetical protein